MWVRAVALASAGLLAACGGGPIAISGRIVDHLGTPIPKAEVVTEPQTDLVVTNSKGFFVLRQRINDLGETEAIAPGVYKIVVRKFGFQDLAFAVTVQGGPSKVPDLHMSPRTPDIGETAPDVLTEEERAPDETSVPNSGI
jgi:hypothetical protein